MRKDKSGFRFGKITVEKPQGEHFTPRAHVKFQIGQNTNLRKVARWLNRGGGYPLMRPLDVIAKHHIHPRARRAA